MKKDVIKKKLKEFVCDSISGAWMGIVVGGGVAIGFVTVLGILIRLN